VLLPSRLKPTTPEPPVSVDVGEKIRLAPVVKYVDVPLS
jgi:hypothetical protein